MKFNIAGFTHKGTGIYQSNEDNILINGNKLNEGEHFIMNQDSCICFVSDGVGGNKGGDFASGFVLSKINSLGFESMGDLNEELYKINEDLLSNSLNNSDLIGCACTLSGIVVIDDLKDFCHIGDSEIWLLRNEMLIKITKDEVLDEDDPRSPILNYLGGYENKLKINTEWEKPEIISGDIFIICSDGLFKSLGVKLVKPILASDKNVEEKIQKLKENCLTLGSEDNVSAVIVEVVEYS